MVWIILHGLFFFAGFSAVEIFGATKKSWTAVAKMTITVQICFHTLSSFFLFFGLMELMEGHPNVPQTKKKKVFRKHLFQDVCFSQKLIQ